MNDVIYRSSTRRRSSATPPTASSDRLVGCPDASIDFVVGANGEEQDRFLAIDM